MFAQVAAILMMVSGGQAAADGAAPTRAGTTPAAADAPKKVCRSLPVTGSIMTKRVCGSAKNWATWEANNADNYVYARNKMPDPMSTVRPQ